MSLWKYVLVLRKDKNYTQFDKRGYLNGIPHQRPVYNLRRLICIETRGNCPIIFKPFSISPLKMENFASSVIRKGKYKEFRLIKS